MIRSHAYNPSNGESCRKVLQLSKAPELTTYSGTSISRSPLTVPGSVLSVAPDLPRCLFVGDIPLLCNEERLFALFSPLGRIESIQLKRDDQASLRSQKQSSTQLQAQTMTKPHSQPFLPPYHQHPLSLSNQYLQPRPSYLNNTRSGLQQLQQMPLQLPTPQQEQRNHLSYGFVKFVAHEDAMKAVRELNGAFVLGRRIRVSWARDNPGLEYLPAEALQSTMGVSASSSSATGRKTAQIHVLYATPMMHVTISEMDLREVFREFGEVLDVTIKKSVMNKEKNIQSGYGFIHFDLSEEGVSSAFRAIHSVNQKCIRNVWYEVTVTHSLRNHLLYSSSSTCPFTSIGFLEPRSISLSFSPEDAPHNHLIFRRSHFD